MARPGLLDGLKRWKVPDGNVKQLGKFTIEKGADKWLSEGEMSIDRATYYYWHFKSDKYLFTVKYTRGIQYSVRIGDEPAHHMYIGAYGETYHICEFYGILSWHKTDLNLDQVKAAVVEWCKRNPVPGLVN